LSGAIDPHVRIAQACGAFEIAVVREQRATASLALWEPHLAAGQLKQPDGGVVRPREQDGHNAPDKEGDAVSSRADRRRDA